MNAQEVTFRIRRSRGSTAVPTSVPEYLERLRGEPPVYRRLP